MARHDRASEGPFDKFSSAHAICAASLPAPTTTLALFGPSDPRVWHPLGSRVVILAAESGNLARLSAEEVGAALGGLLAP